MSRIIKTDNFHTGPLGQSDKNNDSCKYAKEAMSFHPSPTPGGRINRGKSQGGASAGDATNYQHPTHKVRSGNDSKTYRTYAGGEAL